LVSGFAGNFATRCLILRLKCTKFNFGWGSALDLLSVGAYSAPPDPHLDFRGLLLRGGRRRKRRGKGRGGRGPQFEKTTPSSDGF